MNNSSYPDINWQKNQIVLTRNTADSSDEYIDDYVDLYPVSEMNSLLNETIRTIDRLVNAIKIGDTQTVQLVIAQDIKYMFQEIAILSEDTRKTVEDAKKLKEDPYASIDKENALRNKVKRLEEKLRIVKDSDIKSMQKIVNIVKARSNNDKVESVESKGPKITFDSKPVKWPRDGSIKT